MTTTVSPSAITTPLHDDEHQQAAALVLSPLKERSGGLHLGEVTGMAFASLLANKVRSLLTMLGVIIGVASVVALISLGSGASAAITGQLEAVGTNLLTITAGAAQNGPLDVSSNAELTLRDVQAIERLNLPIVGPAAQYGGSAQLVAPAADSTASVVGITAAYQTVNGLSLTSGSFINDEHVASASPVVVLGSSLAEELFGRGPFLGQFVRIEGQSLRVIGVLAAEGGGLGGSVDEQAFVPLSLAQQRLFGGRSADGNDWQVSAISISVRDSAQIDYVQGRIALALREQHRLELDGSEDDFNILNQASLLASLNVITSLLTMFLGAVAAISLLVGGIGIMNIMLVSVSERTREIGLRKAVGARGRDIMLQFVVEALALSLVGGLIGVLVGSSIPLAATLLGLLEAPVTATSVVIALSFSLAVGLFFGIYPAQRAARLNPIEALRND